MSAVVWSTADASPADPIEAALDAQHQHAEDECRAPAAVSLLHHGDTWTCCCGRRRMMVNADRGRRLLLIDESAVDLS